MQCRKCGKEPWKDNCVLTRVNPTGEAGIWECSPDCSHEFNSLADALEHALNESDEKLEC